MYWLRVTLSCITGCWEIVTWLWETSSSTTLWGLHPGWNDCLWASYPRAGWCESIDHECRGICHGESQGAWPKVCIGMQELKTAVCWPYVSPVELLLFAVYPCGTLRQTWILFLFPLSFHTSGVHTLSFYVFDQKDLLQVRRKYCFFFLLWWRCLIMTRQFEKMVTFCLHTK